MYDKQIKTLEDRKRDLITNIAKEKNATGPLAKALKELTARLTRVQSDCFGYVHYHARTIKYLQVG